MCWWCSCLQSEVYELGPAWCSYVVLDLKVASITAIPLVPQSSACAMQSSLSPPSHNLSICSRGLEEQMGMGGACGERRGRGSPIVQMEFSHSAEYNPVVLHPPALVTCIISFISKIRKSVLLPLEAPLDFCPKVLMVLTHTFSQPDHCNMNWTAHIWVNYHKSQKLHTPCFPM